MPAVIALLRRQVGETVESVRMIFHREKPESKEKQKKNAAFERFMLEFKHRVAEGEVRQPH